MTWILRILVWALVLVLAGAAAEVVIRAGADRAVRTEAIVVLGAAQFDGRPQPVFQNRLRHAADVYFLRDGLVVVVGGKLPGDRFTEGEAGRRYLLSQDVPADDVLAVGTGSDTWTSLEAAALALRDEGITSVTVVSDPAHVARSRAMLRHLGIERVEVSPTTEGPGSALTPRYVLRETLGLVRFWIGQDWFRSHVHD